ncbi:MAG: zinc-binding dehydrogenase [Microbacterium sp.]|jgi:NADPH:quinone reductase-like Zn-dependent oxidoreductase|uniref:zinc-binding dehydrogenase n=1 Tax=Microbacterium sp. TaxID=51671 RepID=UPI002835410B|nr:zinc-binding dehydrogenase [Microbacterium sp.]MDR2320310.1 zinc-binding dehydrogenase [Microbacterium sp.]
MRALVHSSFGDPAEVLTVQDMPSPEPGPGQVRLRVLLATVHNHDLLTVRGLYGYKPELPARSGTEAVGMVDAVGEGVDAALLGRRVTVGGAFGAWSEFVLASAAGLIPVPDDIPDEQAAQLGSMPFSAISVLDSLGLAAGDWMIQNAANGAVGRMVAQLGAARGVHVVSLVRRAEGIAELEAQGVQNVVATDAEDWQDRVRALIGGAPIRAGIDSVGGDASGQVAAMLGEGGLLVVFGAMASPTMRISSGDVIFKQLTVRGFWGSKVAAAMPADQRGALFGELLQRIREGVLTLPVSAVLPFERIAEASEDNLRAGREGKILLRP